MYAVPPGLAFHPVPPGIVSSVQSGPVVVPPVMPPPSIHGMMHAGNQHQYPTYALQQVPQLDPGPSQPQRRFQDEPLVPYPSLQSHSTTSDWRGEYGQRHKARAVPVSEASHAATDGTAQSSRSERRRRYSFPAHDTRRHLHENGYHDAKHSQTYPSQPVYPHPHGHSDHAHARGLPHHTHPAYASSTQFGHSRDHAPAHLHHHIHDEPPSSNKLGTSYKPTPSPSESSSRSRSSVAAEEPHSRSLSIPQHRTLWPIRSAMKSNYSPGRRSGRGSVHFLVAPGVGEDTDEGKTRNWDHRFGRSRSRWPGSRNKKRG